LIKPDEFRKLDIVLLFNDDWDVLEILKGWAELTFDAITASAGTVE